MAKPGPAPGPEWPVGGLPAPREGSLCAGGRFAVWPALQQAPAALTAKTTPLAASLREHCCIHNAETVQSIIGNVSIIREVL